MSKTTLFSIGVFSLMLLTFVKYLHHNNPTKEILLSENQETQERGLASDPSWDYSYKNDAYENAPQNQNLAPQGRRAAQSSPPTSAINPQHSQDSYENTHPYDQIYGQDTYHNNYASDPYYSGSHDYYNQEVQFVQDHYDHTYNNEHYSYGAGYSDPVEPPPPSTQDHSHYQNHSAPHTTHNPYNRNVAQENQWAQDQHDPYNHHLPNHYYNDAPDTYDPYSQEHQNNDYYPY